MATTRAASTAWSTFVHGMGEKMVARPGTLVHAVVGNEASDLDSIISALVFAFSLSQTEHPQPLRKALQSKYPDHDHVFVPLINLSPDTVPGCRNDLQLRLDALDLLNRLKVDLDQLNFARGSAVPTLQKLHEQQCLKLVLVDHNEWTGDAAFAGDVEAIVDHHKDFGQHAESVLPGCRVIEPVGSACSLVAQSMEDAGQTDLLRADGGLLAWALASVILTDTNNLNTTTNVVLPVDQRQCAALCAIAGIDDRQARTAEVLRLRSCMDGFGVNDMLRKDYKQWEAVVDGGRPLKYGIASLITSYHTFSQVEAKVPGQTHFEAMRTFAASLGLDVLAVMFMVIEDGGVRRELLVHVPQPKSSSTQLVPLPFGGFVGSLPVALGVTPRALDLGRVDRPSASADADAGATAGTDTDAGAQSAPLDFALFDQADPRKSRKKVQPALHDVLLTLERPE